MKTLSVEELINNPEKLERRLAEIDRKADDHVLPLKVVNDRLASLTDAAGQSEGRQLTVSFDELFDLSNAVFVYLKKSKKVSN